MSAPVEPLNPKPTRSDIQNRIAKWALDRATKANSSLLKTQGKDISVKQNIASLPEPAKVMAPQIERTQAAAPNSTAQTPIALRDYMTAYTPKKRTVNYERFTQ